MNTIELNDEARQEILNKAMEIKKENDLSLMESVTKLQEAAVKMGEEEFLDVLCQYKSELIAALF